MQRRGARCNRIRRRFDGVDRLAQCDGLRRGAGFGCKIPPIHLSVAVDPGAIGASDREIDPGEAAPVRQRDQEIGGRFRAARGDGRARLRRAELPPPKACKGIGSALSWKCAEESLEAPYYIVGQLIYHTRPRGVITYGYQGRN